MSHPFEFGSKVIADGDAGNPMVVAGFLYRRDGAVDVECSFWVNGDLKAVWVAAWRLERYN